MTVIFSEDWTGTNGDPWDSGRWINLQPDNGTNVTDIQGNKGRMVSRNDEGDVHRWASADMDAAADFRIDVVFDAPTGTNSRPYLFARTQDSSNSPDGYRLHCRLGTSGGPVELAALDSGTTVLAEVGINFEAVPYRLIWELDGTAHRVKIWKASDSEPGSWLINTTDSTWSSGKIALRYTSASATTRTCLWDDLTVTDLSAAGGGSIVPITMAHSRRRRVA